MEVHPIHDPATASIAGGAAHLDSRTMVRWIEATRRPFELPSHIDLAKRDGLISDLTRQICR